MSLSIIKNAYEINHELRNSWIVQYRFDWTFEHTYYLKWKWQFNGWYMRQAPAAHNIFIFSLHARAMLFRAQFVFHVSLDLFLQNTVVSLRWCFPYRLYLWQRERKRLVLWECFFTFSFLQWSLAAKLSHAQSRKMKKKKVQMALVISFMEDFYCLLTSSVNFFFRLLFKLLGGIFGILKLH